jgi:ribonucleoside-diphosphate reductase alpha chain
MTHLQLRENELSRFPSIVSPYVPEGHLTELEGLQRLVMLDRYSERDNTLTTLKEGDIVVLTVKEDPEYPTQGFGKVTAINGNQITVNVQFPEFIDGVDLPLVTKHSSNVIKPLETYWEQIAYRNARAVSGIETTVEKKAEWFQKFYWMLRNFLAIPGGRILYGAGSESEVTLFNCYVLPYIKDSRQGIVGKHIMEATEIMARGGGVGSNISTLRPSKAPVIGVNGSSSGSVTWGDYISKLTKLISQGGSRRGAQMIGESDWHPDIIEFILCKVQNHHVLAKIIAEVNDEYIKNRAEYYLVRDKDGKPVGVRDKNFMTGANISVLVSHDLMRAVEADEDWVLRYPDIENFTPEQKKFYDEQWHELGDVRKWEALELPVKVYHKLKATALWELLNIAARYSAEPGIIFIDECNDKSNAWYYAPLVVTNPCGEQPLPAYGVCNLIAINLEKMYDAQLDDVNWELLKEVTIISQRFADNVIDLSPYFLEENERMAKGERRVGKGEMGLADLMIYLKLPYGSEAMLEKTDKIFELITVESYLASSDIAEEKGSFPFFDCEKYLQSGFMQTMPVVVTDSIKKKGIRNVCSITIAPTGSTGTMVGVSTGVEPYFAFKYYRSGRLGKFIEVNTPMAEAYFAANPDATKLPDYFVSAQDLAPLDHAKVQGAIQRWVDSAISKTCNAPSTFTVEQNKELYMTAWKLGCKGVTVYVDGSRDSQVLSVEAKDNEFVDEAVESEIVSPAPALVLVTAGGEEITNEMMTEDTRACNFTFDAQGNMVKECH